MSNQIYTRLSIKKDNNFSKNSFDMLKMIVLKISYSKEYFFEPQEIEFLNNSEFSLSKGILSNPVDISKFNIELKLLLSKLLQEKYEESDVKQRMKHPTRFEKFFFEGRKYIVNYTTSSLQRLFYTLFLKIDLIDKFLNEGVKINIIIE